MNEDRSLPFRERAYTAYEEAVANLKRVDAEFREHPLEEIEDYRDPLSLDTRKEVTVLLSWGGPSDGFKVYFDEGGTPMSGVYFLADWFEYEEFRLSETELNSVLSIYFERLSLPPTQTWGEPQNLNVRAAGRILAERR
jgi:hypothetical protein